LGGQKFVGSGCPVMPGAKIVNLKGPYPSAGRAQIHKSRAGLRGQTLSVKVQAAGSTKWVKGLNRSRGRALRPAAQPTR
jgi:hypothetical protein